MTEHEPDPQQLLTALTTEHFTLQGARSQTVSESASRASLYLFSVSSTLVALGFGQRQIIELGQTRVFDGGADGSTSTNDNQVFQIQGIFNP